MELLQTIPAFLFLITIVGGARLLLSRHFYPASLIIQKYSLAASPQPSARPIVEIVGRIQGIMAFVLSLMGFSPIARFTIAGTEVRQEYTSLFGQQSQFIPLQCVSNFEAGVQKPIGSLVWGAIVVLGGISMSVALRTWAPIAIGLLIGIGLVVHYVLTKRFFIVIHANGGPAIQLAFKPNVIEGIPIDVSRALDVVGVIRDLVLQRGTVPPVIAPASAIPARQFASSNSAFPARLEPLDETDESDEEFTAWSAAHSSGDGQFSEWEDSVEAVVEPVEDDEDAALRLFNEAKGVAQTGARRQAIAILLDIMRKYPSTSVAQKARRSLEKNGIDV